MNLDRNEITDETFMIRVVFDKNGLINTATVNRLMKLIY